MDPLLWKRIGELFAAARPLSGKSRIAFLKENCGQDQSLFEQVECLLDIDGKPGLLESTLTISTLPVRRGTHVTPLRRFLAKTARPESSRFQRQAQKRTGRTCRSFDVGE
jgi:hypothetical protein